MAIMDPAPMISAMPKSPKGGTVWSQSFHSQKLAKTNNEYSKIAT